MHDDHKSLIVLVAVSTMLDMQRMRERDPGSIIICGFSNYPGEGDDIVLGNDQDLLGPYTVPYNLIELTGSGLGKDTIDIGDEPGFDPYQDAPRRYRHPRNRRMKKWKRRNRRK